MQYPICRWLRIAAFTFAICLLAMACGDSSPIAQSPVDAYANANETVDGTSVDPGQTPIELPSDEGSFRFDLNSDAFFDFPYPSDLRLTASGAPDVREFAPDSDAELLDLARTELLKDAKGFSPLSSVYIGLRTAIDLSTLPDDGTDSGDVFIIDITEGSPDYGRRLPVTLSWSDQGGGYWPANTLAIHPLFQRPPRPATTYAAIVTRGVKAADGSDLTPPGIIAQLKTLRGALEDPVVANLAPLPELLEEAGVAWGDVVMAAVYTTSDPMAELREFSAWISGNMPTPEVSDIALVETRSAFEVYEGTWTSHEFLSGTAPYMAFGEGRLSMEDKQAVNLRFAVSVPIGEPPEAGWPVVLYSHGLGENYRGFVDVVAGPMANRGVAVIGIDPPLQGERNPTSQDDRDLIIALAVNNIVAGREILRQGVLDNIALARLVWEADFGPSVSLDATRVSFIGHSEGAQIGALLLPLEPSIGAGLLSEGGGGGAITMLELNLDGTDIAGLVGLALGVDSKVETLDLEHPLTRVMIQPLLDAADPLHCARQIFVEPPQSGVAHSLVMIEGFEDPLTPPPSMEALAAAASLPIAEPVGREIEGLILEGIAPVPLPVSGNLPHGVTGALIQLPNVGHYGIYLNGPLRKQIFDFIGSSFGADPPTLAPRP